MSNLPEICALKAVIRAEGKDAKGLGFSEAMPIFQTALSKTEIKTLAVMVRSFKRTGADTTALKNK